MTRQVRHAFFSKHRVQILLIIVALIVGLVSSLFIFNWREHKKDLHFEVTFVEPRQAIVFWKTDHDTTGYVRYGKSARNRSQVVEQTSSVPGEIHTVVLNDLPLEGVYLTLHNRSDSPFLLNNPVFISYDPTTLE